MTSTLALIPARGGSKGIPRKNLKPLAGRPLIVWTIEQALVTPGLDVCVSTEDVEIAEVARSAGAAVIDRPAELAADTTATEPVVEHAIAELTAQGARPDQVMLLQATSPVRLPGTMTRALSEFAGSGADSMVGVVPEPIFIWQKEPRVRALYPVTNRPRRQDMTPDQLRYRETGSLYLTRTEIYEQAHNRLGGRIELFVMDPVEGTDIDAPHDFALAEATLAQIRSQEHPTA
ncbi:acylneuraminate cytidylyltransferase family protein [Acidipropionibacterium acidipropionici]|uniref:Acylneuraminate cytidylyltransferase n=1 Tax=Acidipropionibacterium acidipropionici TaxID=1748 RepID=A0AAC8YGK7_9ACTN|nr:acylneuraminate cytidylyltransferase family protein [Acidipropionibacterium acidipropionici]AMS06109.1 acylneuraminate cytidylyltransferase [Acidipropionibacterium acidipropionici]AOZ47572.1 acylneuraminate cytidylyltransferase [Acidipropionibacterium acidipropionici]AZP39105.1 acylneuraminate cytidylyltransferase family protein [Acidipropionibacterium acidipropionici]